MKILLSALLLLSFSHQGHAAKLSRRGFLSWGIGSGTAAIANQALPAPATTPAPPVAAIPPVVEIVRPPIPTNYLENRITNLLTGHLKQSDRFRSLESDEGVDRYLTEKALHDRAKEYERLGEPVSWDMKQYYDNPPTQNLEYEAKIKARVDALMKIEKKVAQEFELTHEQVAEEIDRLYFPALDIKAGSYASAATDPVFLGYADNPQSHYYHYQELERSFAPAGVEVRERYIELLSEVYPKEAYMTLFEEIFQRYYSKGFLYFQKDLPVGFPDRDRIWSSNDLHHFLETRDPRYLRTPSTDPADIRRIKKYWKDISMSAPTTESTSTPRILSLIDVIKKRLPYGVNIFNKGSIEQAISNPREVFLAPQPAADVATTASNELATAAPSELATVAKIAARTIAGSVINATVAATTQEGVQSEVTTKNPNDCQPLLIEHKPETPMPIVQEQQGEKVEELK